MVADGVGRAGIRHTDGKVERAKTRMEAVAELSDLPGCRDCVRKL